MADYVLKLDTLAKVQTTCTALGIWKPAVAASGDQPAQPAAPIQTGVLTKKHENYFFNYVGVVYEPTGATTTDAMGNDVPTMAAIPGYWVRVRYNGTVPAALLANPPTGITIYPPLKYLADGITPDPDYVQPGYGQIA
jgi:hypothetical protein